MYFSSYARYTYSSYVYGYVFMTMKVFWLFLRKLEKNDRRQQEDEVEKKIGKLYKELLVRAYQVAWKNKKEASQRSKTS